MAVAMLRDLAEGDVGGGVGVGVGGGAEEEEQRIPV